MKYIPRMKGLSVCIKRSIAESTKKSLFLLGAASLVSASGVATAQTGIDTDADAKEVTTLEEVVVSGMKSSVADAIAIKRDSSGIVDAISADDIASFPDENIAEAIQRIPGVQIQRSNGRGALISIRGLGPEYAGTTINGQAFAGAQFTGGFRYDIIQSQLASAVEVYKTSWAELTDGGLSGVVNISTGKPLKYDEPQLVLGADYNYSSDVSDGRVGGGFTFIDQFADNTVGLLFSVAYQPLETRYDLQFQQRQNNVDANGDGEPDYTAQGIPVEYSDRPRFRREDGSTDRWLINGALQFQPSDDVEFNLTAVVAMDDRDVYFRQLVPLFSGGSPSPTVTLLDPFQDTVTQVIAQNARAEGNHTLQTEARDSSAYTADVQWNITDNWIANAVLHYTAGSYDQLENNVVSGIRTDFQTNMDFNNPSVVSNGLNPVNEVSSWATENLFRYTGGGVDRSYDSDEIATQFDMAYVFDDSWMSAIKFGAKYRSQGLDTNAYGFNADYLDPDFPINVPSIVDSPYVVRDFTNGQFPGLNLNYVLPDIDAVLKSLKEGGFDLTQSQPSERVTEFFEIDRDITAAYLQLDFETDRWRGNVGMRYAHTKRKVDTFSYNDGEVVEIGAIIIVGGGVGVPTSNTFTYDNWLPSFNLAYDITDDLIVRAAAGRTLVRPIIGNTAVFGQAVSADTSDGQITVTVNEGSYDLPAMTSDNYDLSLEWYFADAGIVSLAYFRKDVSNQVVGELVCPSDWPLADVSVDPALNECVGTNGAIYNITRNRVTNGTTKLDGFELAYSQAFDFLPGPFDGLGVMANATFLDASNQQEEVPLAGHSEKTYNVVAYWEKYGWGARVAFNYRSDYVVNNNALFDGSNYGQQGTPYFQPGRTLEARSQIDISVSYQFNDHWKLSLEGLNVNEDYEHAYRMIPGRLQTVGTFGSTWILGLRYAL